MLFSSSLFLFLFLPAVLLLYFGPLRPWRTGQNAFLFLASLFFYAWGEPWFVLVLLGSIVLNYLIGLAAGRVRSKGGKGRVFVVLATLIVNIGIIFVFKYLIFTIGTINALLGTQITVPMIGLPMGISFFTLHSISYVLDILRGKGEAQKNPLNLGLYITLFPQLIAGPIIRYGTIAAELKERRENWEDFSSGVCRFIFGLGKKVLLANNLAQIADAAVGAGGGSVSLAWLGAISYMLQLFFDFSGYSDMAIGLGRMFGFHFPENCNYPFISNSVAELWRRWHISLGAWFRDYVYIPMGGSRVPRGRLVLNLLVVWFLTGLWHGANWTFILWGLSFFVALFFEKLTPFGAFLDRHKGFGIFYTVTYFCIGFVFFRADNLTAAFHYLGSMIGLWGGSFWSAATTLYLNEFKYFLLAGVLCSTPLFRVLGRRLPQKSLLLDTGYSIVTTAILAVSVAYIIKGTYNPFIYFNF
ncbi:MAG: MBOAT family protein [Oscillospiraceae bacterium]|nr:MBOAT family protein [Oscillospiraceae bacterium]